MIKAKQARATSSRSSQGLRFYLESLSSYLPVLGLALKHHRVLVLADVAVIVILNLLRALLSLYPIILREGALMPSSTGVGKEVRSHGLDGSLRGRRDLSEGLEILLGRPTLWEGRQRVGCHCYGRHRCEEMIPTGLGGVVSLFFFFKADEFFPPKLFFLGGSTTPARPYGQ